MSSIINRADLTFMLRDWLDIESLLGRPRFGAHSFETVEAMLDAAETIGVDLLAPSLRSGDLREPWIDEQQQVRVNPDVRKAVQAIIDSGLFGAVFEDELGGLQLPFLVYIAAMGVLHSASSAATFYMMLTVGNARLIATGADRALFDAFGAPQVQGEMLGTMCLSEPHAGSSLGDITTRAVAESQDGLGQRYRLSGRKMWISGGDQDVTDNIVHLVLAKVVNEDGSLPAGSRGISLFVVPKILPDGTRNDVIVSGLNHKMGSRALPNCAMNLGDGYTTPGGSAGAVGWLVGKTGQGLPLMFQMMNEARISVGVASAMTAYRGYLISLRYARERLQGRAIGSSSGPQQPIAEHPDVRRMLLAQKAICEGAIALTLYAARLQDDEDTAPDSQEREDAGALLGLLTPIAKSWPAEFGQVSLHHAIQILGGAGYTRDFDVELLYRDNRLNPIHEGTTGIQGLDLVNRKIRKDGGKTYRTLRARVDATLGRAESHASLSVDAAALRSAWQQVDAAVAILLSAPDDAATAAHATAFLTAMGHGVTGWLWLDMAELASRQLSTALVEAQRNHLSGKIKACRHFAEVELPQITGWLAPLHTGHDTTLSIRIEEFLGEMA